MNKFSACAVTVALSTLVAAGGAMARESIFRQTLPTQCQHVVELTRKNTSVIESVYNSRLPLLVRVDSACLPRYLTTKQVWMLREWVKRGNTLWVSFNPLRRNAPQNNSWAELFDITATSVTDTIIVSAKNGLIRPHPVTTGVRYLHVGSHSITPNAYYFSGANLIPLVNVAADRPVFALLQYGKGYVAFDGFGFLRFETDVTTVTHGTYDEQVFWLNFLVWSGACGQHGQRLAREYNRCGPGSVCVPRTAARAPADTGLTGPEARTRFYGEDIYFDYDSAVLREAERQKLQFKAAYMRANPGVNVTIQGHCDQRGSEALNTDLGRRRAQAIRNYMVSLGTARSRLSTASYGKTSPVCHVQSESCWQRNRRGHFVPR